MQSEISKNIYHKNNEVKFNLTVVLSQTNLGNTSYRALKNTFKRKTTQRESLICI